MKAYRRFYAKEEAGFDIDSRRFSPGAKKYFKLDNKYPYFKTIITNDAKKQEKIEFYNSNESIDSE